MFIIEFMYEQEMHSSIVFIHHRENLAMFGNAQKRTMGHVRKLYLVSLIVRRYVWKGRGHWCVETPVNT